MLTASLGELGRTADARSREMEELGHLPADLADALIGTGLFQAWVPARYGGAERSVVDVLDAVEEAAYWEGSLGWCAMIGATTSLLAAWLEPGWAKEVYGDPRSCTGGFALPAGRARVVEGGLSVAGRWQWGSGTDHCTWIGGGCLLVDGDGNVSPRPDGLVAPFVLFDPADVELLDTWDVVGMRATGSTDYEVADAFVPEGRWAEPMTTPPLVDASLYRFPFLGALAVGVSAVALGLARRAFDELVELAGSKRPAQSNRTLAERAVVQVEVASAEAAFRSARAFVRERVEAAEAAALEGPLDASHRRDIRLAATTSTLRAKEAVDLLYHAAGGSSVYRTSPLERVFRDVHVATQHGMVAPRTLEPLGRMALGLPTDTTML
ncbi:MAG: flavin-dependent monooxygenase [Acidimicrobiia bacterium]|nr:flavin-dependent monooxygenase [Acidimicrobiia bacterium]